MATLSTNSLLKTPLVQALAQWLWKETPNNNTSNEQPLLSPELCLASLPHMTTDCWMRVVVKGMGISMILGACFNKVPTILNILTSRTVAGLPKSSIYGEAFIAVNATLYGYLKQFPFTAYGENAAIAVQCIMVVFLMWKYSEGKKQSDKDSTISILTAADALGTTTTSKEQIGVTIGTVFYIFTIPNFLPSSLHYLLMNSVMPVMMYARGSQILEAYRLKHTGTQSVITTFVSLSGNLGRLWTTINEVGYDLPALQWYLISALLNFILFAQWVLYLKNTNKFMDDVRLQRTYVLPKEA